MQYICYTIHGSFNSRKFKEKKIDVTNYLKIVELNSKIELGPFEIDFVTLTHSILEPNGLCITTPEGVVLHTGDWKVDPNPLIGNIVDENLSLLEKEV